MTPLQRSESAFDRFSFLVFGVLAVEMMIGGGGRLTAFGPVSLRMVLYAFAAVLTIIHFLSGKRLPKEFIRLMLFSAAVLALATLVGIVNGSPRAAWWEDVKPLLYLFMLPFFYFSISGKERLLTTITLIRGSSVFLACAFLVVLLLIHSGVWPFLNFYHLVLPTQEFFFRGEISFVYKGFVYLGVGIFFWHFQRTNKLVIALLVFAMVITFTRGFLLALLLTYALYFAWKFLSTRKAALALSAILFFACGVLTITAGQDAISFVSRMIDYSQRTRTQDTRSLNPDTLNATLLGDRQYSDSKRTVQLQQVADRVTIASALWGHGFGQGIPERPVHMEISYLEIFHKQGIIGLSFWMYFLWLIVKRFRAANDPLAVPLLLATCYILIQSLVNQYINNPIGISVALVSLAGLERLSDAKSL